MSIIGNPLLLGGGSGSSYAFIIANYPSGATCTCSGATDSEDITSTQKLFHIPSNGTYTVVATDGSLSVSNSVSITHKGQSADITLVFWGYQSWCVTGGVDPSCYSSLSDVLANQVDVRILMTKHASADYLYSWYQYDSTVLDTVMASTYGAKWLGLRDYVCDKFMANATAKVTMLASSNWEYILKDKVPKMTSNTAPYGVCSSSGVIYSQYAEWHAFDGDKSITDANRYICNIPTGYIQYQFTNPICVRRLSYIICANRAPRDVIIQGSNDNSTWTDIYSFVCENTWTTEIFKSFDNENYYLYYRFKVNTSYTANEFGFHYLQFFGRSLDVSIPTMTSNTAPYGVASASTIYDSNYAAYKAFDGNYSAYGWLPNSSDRFEVANIVYEFTTPIIAKFVSIFSYAGGGIGAINGRWDLYGSNNGTEYSIIQSSLLTPMKSINYTFSVPNFNTYKYYKFVYMASEGLTNSAGWKFQIFGLDYTERANRTYVYDHGVELIPFTFSTDNAIQIREDSQMYFEMTSGNTSVGFITNSLNLTDYNFLRGIAGDKFKNINTTFFVSSKSVLNFNITYDAYKEYLTIIPYHLYFDISSINADKYIGVASNSGGTMRSFSIKEFWLE